MTLPNPFTPEEMKFIKKVFGHYHKDKDISDEEAGKAYALYRKVSGLVHDETTKKLLKEVSSHPRKPKR